MGFLARICLRPSARTPVKTVARTEAVPGVGLVGDHAGGGNRQVTLMEEEKWGAACADLGKELDAGGRRANLIVRGVSLLEAIGRELRVGACRIRVVGEARPCRLLDDVEPRLMKALDPDTRAGVYGRIVEGGAIEVGASVELVEQSTDERTEQQDLPFKGESEEAIT